MTTIDTPHTAVAPTAGARVIPALFSAIATWNDQRATRKVLSSLTDRELDDIGLKRSDIAKL